MSERLGALFGRELYKGSNPFTLSGIRVYANRLITCIITIAPVPEVVNSTFGPLSPQTGGGSNQPSRQTYGLSINS